MTKKKSNIQLGTHTNIYVGCSPETIGLEAVKIDKTTSIVFRKFTIAHYTLHISSVLNTAHPFCIGCKSFSTKDVIDLHNYYVEGKKLAKFKTIRKISKSGKTKPFTMKIVEETKKFFIMSNNRAYSKTQYEKVDGACKPKIRVSYDNNYTYVEGYSARQTASAFKENLTSLKDIAVLLSILDKDGIDKVLEFVNK